jgi:hypothetical protein
MIRVRMFRRRPLDEDGDVAFDSVSGDPFLRVRLPVVRIARLVDGKHAEQESELLAGYFLRTDRYNAHGRSKNREPPGGGPLCVGAKIAAGEAYSSLDADRDEAKRARTCIDSKTQVVDEKTVCVVSCQRSPEPVFLKWKGLKTDPQGDFFVRSGPGSVKLSAASAREYIKTRFPTAG